MLNKKGLVSIANMEFKMQFDKIILTPNREDINKLDFLKKKTTVAD